MEQTILCWNVCPTVSIFQGEICETYPFIEVGWFERGQEIRDAYAQVLTKHILSTGHT